jgi:hypothetical protein
MKCEKCEQVNAPDATSCTWCGNPLVPLIASNVIPGRDVGQLIGHTLNLYGNNFWKFILIGLPPQLLGLITLLILPDFGTSFTAEFGTEQSYEAALEEFRDAMLVIFPLAIIAGLVSLVVQGATIHAVGKLYLGQNIDVLRSLGRGFSKLWVLLASLIVIVLALLFTLPLMLILVGFVLAVFLMVSWSFVFQLVVIEGAGPISALGGSYNLVKGSRCRVFGVILVFALINITLQIFMTVATGVVSEINEPISVFLSVVGYAVMAPLWMIALTVFYLDLRARKEGLTLDSLAVEYGHDVVGVPVSDDLRNR